MDSSTSRRYFAAVLAAAAVLVSVESGRSVAAPVVPPAVTCAACVVIDERGSVLFARHAHALLANASTTKMVTAIVVAARAGPDEQVTVSAAAAATGGGGLDLNAGDRASVRDLTVAMLLSSSNDAAVALAEHVAGSETDFVELMNAFVADIGARRTTFVTAHGLDAAGHVSTASDLARIGLALLRRPVLADIVALPEAEVRIDGDVLGVENRNLLLESYPGAVGIKTGFTAAAGNVLVAAAERVGRRLIVVAMDSVNSFADAAALLDFGFAKLSRTLLLGSRSPLAAVVLDPAGVVAVLPASRVRGPTDPSNVEVLFTPKRNLELPVEAGERVGEFRLVAGGKTVAVVDGVAQTAVPAPSEAPGLSAVGRLLELAAVVLRPGS